MPRRKRFDLFQEGMENDENKKIPEIRTSAALRSHQVSNATVRYFTVTRSGSGVESARTLPSNIAPIMTLLVQEISFTRK